MLSQDAELVQDNPWPAVTGLALGIVVGFLVGWALFTGSPGAPLTDTPDRTAPREGVVLTASSLLAALEHGADVVQQGSTQAAVVVDGTDSGAFAELPAAPLWGALPPDLKRALARRAPEVAGPPLTIDRAALLAQALDDGLLGKQGKEFLRSDKRASGAGKALKELDPAIVTMTDGRSSTVAQLAVVRVAGQDVVIAVAFTPEGDADPLKALESLSEPLAEVLRNAADDA
jgi:hypothetical protein